MRLLQRTGPEVDIVELVMPAVVTERPDLGPGAQNKLVRLVIAPVRMSRVDAAGEVFGADAAYEAGDDAAATEMIEHGEFLGHRHRIAYQRQRAPEDRDLRLFGRACERGRNEVGRRHQPVGGLMMLVHADAVEAEPVGELELADISGVELFTDRG